MNFGWHAQLVTEDFGRTQRLQVAQFRAPGYTDVLFIEEGQVVFKNVPEGLRIPSDAGISLPIEAWAAIAEALKPGPSQDQVEVLKESLALERKRVDTVMHRLFNKMDAL